MGDFLILVVHLIGTVARLARPGRLGSVVAESVLVRDPLLKNRGRKRPPNLRVWDRMLARAPVPQTDHRLICFFRLARIAKHSRQVTFSGSAVVSTISLTRGSPRQALPIRLHG